MPGVAAAAKSVNWIELNCLPQPFNAYGTFTTISPSSMVLTLLARTISKVSSSIVVSVNENWIPLVVKLGRRSMGWPL
jgi:hypothetical protein